MYSNDAKNMLFFVLQKSGLIFFFFFHFLLEEDGSFKESQNRDDGRLR